MVVSMISQTAYANCECLAKVCPNQAIAKGSKTKQVILECTGQTSWSGSVKVCTGQGWKDEAIEGECKKPKVCGTKDGVSSCMSRAEMERIESASAVSSNGFETELISDPQNVTWKQFLMLNALVSAVTSIFVMAMACTICYWVSRCRSPRRRKKDRQVWQKIEDEIKDEQVV
eukprot:CAMPEP_0197076962 /NCGR_PEP_ID=MMETSP1384-20130603/212382_1 /TAXON_ID=29189 /ORGANISM="Ammonia sp." /LENGTH=172 /DNA_ID=CAMNT_0042515821 /DNA_START=96 /DNA_END=614 /DNA_ORIENTATION=-